VVTNCTEAALRAAIAGGGLVTFACDGTITLASTITNDVNLTLDGSGRQVTISGGGAVRLFYVMTNVQFTAVNLTLANGFASAGGAVRNSAGRVSLIGVTLRTNVANSAALFEPGTSLGAGGAIWNLGGAVGATNCSFNANTARNSNASAESRGGAIRNESGQMDLVRCSFVGNQAWGVSASNPQSTGNSATGGAIHNSGALTADFCAFTGNSAIAGAGYSVYGTAGGAAIGGAVWNSGALAINRSTFASNTVTGGNGGQGYNGTVVMEQGLPGGNGGAGASGDGGALFNIGTASLVNCTIAGNRGQGGSGGAGGAGGGGPVHYGGNGGNGGSGGSGIGGIDGTCDLTNCTLAWNVGVAGSGGAGGPGGTGVNGSGAPGSPGGNGSASGATPCAPMFNTLIASNSPGGNDTFTDPKLGPLVGNGGPTLTMALLPGSPAIDAGNTLLAPTTDQRGFPRPALLAADIGAFEYGSVMPAIAVSRAGAAGLNILGSGNAGQPCRLLSSPDLTSWASIATSQIGTNGTVLFYDNYAPGSACRFYRLVMP
jgi:hypothetical protein